MSTTQSNKRTMTSAICEMSVAQVRKYLGETRKRWTTQTLNHPMYITDKLSNGMTIQEFALKFQQGHHQKRHNKGRKYAKSNDGDDADNTNSDISDSDMDIDEDELKQDLVTDTEGDDNSVSTPSPPSPSMLKRKGKISKSEETSISQLLSKTTKKRGRPKKNKAEEPVQTPKKRESHSRSLMDFCKSSH